MNSGAVLIIILAPTNTVIGAIIPLTAIFGVQQTVSHMGINKTYNRLGISHHRNKAIALDFIYTVYLPGEASNRREGNFP